MKGIIIFDNSNDLVYRRVDDELTSHLFELAVKDGLIKKTFANVDPASYLSKDAMIQIFSPLIASYNVMHGQFGESYQSIKTEIGTCIQFKKIENHVVLCIGGGDGGFEHQEINMFVTFVKMLYGPSLYLMHDNSIMSNGKTRKEILSNMMTEWNILHTDCQMFLAEALERLLLNPDIAALCVNLLQDILVKARASQQTRGSFSHSFILVNHKLLALYSSRNSGQLPKKCILLLLILAKALQTTTACSACTVLKHPAGASRRGSSADNAYMHSEFLSFLVFLPSYDDDIVPYMVYFLKIKPKIMLVLLCEIVTKTSLANNLTSLVKSFDNMQNHPASRVPLCSLDALRSVFESAMISLEKLKATENNPQYAKVLAIKWDQMMHHGLQEYLRNLTQTVIKSRLESAVSSTCELCKRIFGDIVLRQSLQWETSPEERAALAEIKKLTLKRLNDCSSFLEAKAEQNITMSSYVAEFPGLIHFIYVDRNTDCMIAPPVVLTEGHLKGRASLKNKIWNMLYFGRKCASGACPLFCSWQQADLRYYYSIWFENAHGRNIKPTRAVNLQFLSEKQIISGNFFRELKERCFPGASHDHIFCYELFCIYLVTIDSPDVIEQSQRLAAKLWNFSGAHRVSLDLLS